jgi:hypothetical protein
MDLEIQIKQIIGDVLTDDKNNAYIINGRTFSNIRKVLYSNDGHLVLQKINKKIMVVNGSKTHKIKNGFAYRNDVKFSASEDSYLIYNKHQCMIFDIDSDNKLTKSTIKPKHGIIIYAHNHTIVSETDNEFNIHVVDEDIKLTIVKGESQPMFDRQFMFVNNTVYNLLSGKSYKITFGDTNADVVKLITTNAYIGMLFANEVGIIYDTYIGNYKEVNGTIDLVKSDCVVYCVTENKIVDMYETTKSEGYTSRDGYLIMDGFVCRIDEPMDDDEPPRIYPTEFKLIV